MFNVLQGVFSFHFMSSESCMSVELFLDFYFGRTNRHSCRSGLCSVLLLIFYFVCLEFRRLNFSLVTTSHNTIRSTKGNSPMEHLRFSILCSGKTTSDNLDLTSHNGIGETVDRRLLQMSGSSLQEQMNIRVKG